MKPSRVAGLLLLLFVSTIAPQLLSTQTNDTAAERARALRLFNQNKFMEVLPLFEDLVAKDPKDPELLVGLGTCLVSKAATVEDDAASAAIRVRARKLLQQAKDMGFKNGLMENLLELLPEDGMIHYSSAPADQAMRAAEAAFGREEFKEAIVQYSRVLQFDPKNYSAVLYIGDSYFAMKDFSNAAIWYERATQFDPNRETAWRYWSDMATKSGDLGQGRRLAIQAVVADPYNNIPWRGLQQWATFAHVQLTMPKITPHTSVSSNGERNITIGVDPKSGASNSAAAWITYGAVRALWPVKFAQQYPKEKEYRHTLQEETEALVSVAKVFTELAESDKKKNKPAQEPDADIKMLLKLYEAGLIEPYVLLSAPDKGIAQDYEGYREKNREKLVRYLSDFVVPGVPARSVVPK